MEPFDLRAFVITLTSVEGNKERWSKLVQNGASDDEIKEQISEEFGLGTGFGSRGFASTWGVGGSNPRFEWYFDLNGPHYKMEGKELIDAVRGVFHISEKDGSLQLSLF